MLTEIISLCIASYLVNGCAARKNMNLLIKKKNNKSLKVGFIYVGKINNLPWTYQHHLGKEMLSDNFNGKIEIIYKEMVPGGFEGENTIRELAEDGYNIIFATSFGYMDSINKVAKEYPNIKFEHATGWKRSSNVSTYNVRFYQGRTIIGHIAARMTKNKIIGIIASFPLPEIIRGINAMTLSAQKVNKNIKVEIRWVYSWFDPEKEVEAAKYLIAKGANIIMQHTESLKVLEYVETKSTNENPIWCFGNRSNLNQEFPKTLLTSIEANWGVYYLDRVNDLKDGKYTDQSDTWGGFEKNMIKMGEYNSAMGEELINEVKRMEEDLSSGKINSFLGPIKDNKGNIMIEAGRFATDKELLSMNYYVEGISEKNNPP
jgi:basic membrane protein A and related proteins